MKERLGRGWVRIVFVISKRKITYFFNIEGCLINRLASSVYPQRILCFAFNYLNHGGNGESAETTKKKHISYLASFSAYRIIICDLPFRAGIIINYLTQPRHKCTGLKYLLIPSNCPNYFRYLFRKAICALLDLSNKTLG